MPETIVKYDRAKAAVFVQEMISPSLISDLTESNESIARVLDLLTDRERKAVILLYGLIDGQPRTYKAVARLRGVSETRVGILKRNAKYKLRKAHNLPPRWQSTCLS